MNDAHWGIAYGNNPAGTTLDLCEISKLTQLKKHLDLSGNPQHDSISEEDIGDLTGLRSFSISGCKKVDSLEPLSDLTGMSSLDMSGCITVPSFKPLRGLTGAHR